MPQESFEYSGRLLRVDLTKERITIESVGLEILKKYVGGSGLGARILYDEVPPGTEWSDPENRLILATGPLGGTRMAGSGTFSVVTKGCLTNGATTTQANGFFGAYLKFNGLIGIIVQGSCSHWVYLYIHNGQAEFRDAGGLLGKDTWETEDLIKQELGYSERSMSVYSIGPAGENLVKFAGIIGDRGHAAAHNGVGAVMGSKKLKAIGIERGKKAVELCDKGRFSVLAEQMRKAVLNNPAGKLYNELGTSTLFGNRLINGDLPIQNLNTSLFPNSEAFSGKNYRNSKVFDIRPSPCWACPSRHLHIMKIKEGPYAGYIGEEPEYECWAAFGPLILNYDVPGAFVLSNEADKLGLDVNEAGWLMAFVIDCYERGILSKKDTDGLEMKWGGVEAVRTLLHNIAHRSGFGNILAEGIKRAAETIGGEALNQAVYIQKGHAPRGHDHRARWIEIFDSATSNTGTIETGPITDFVPEFMIPVYKDPYSPDDISLYLAKFKPLRQFADCLGICLFRVCGYFTLMVDLVNAATGWNTSVDDAIQVSSRNVNLLRAFNSRHGVNLAGEFPSPKYGSVPMDGPAKGKDIKPHWENTMAQYYRYMGWDRTSGKPLPETLQSLGLEKEIDDLWH